MGGGVMRNAMKVSNGTFRGPTFSPASGQSAMKPSRPASAAMSSSSETKHVAADVAAPWDVDAWWFADEDASELVMEAGEPMPRLVFNGGVPSLQEAKEATIEFKEAIDQIYLSSISSNKPEVSSNGSRVSTQYPHSDQLKTKSSESELVPKRALQAFKYLRDNPKAQAVVASILTDRNVWSAIMQNPVLNDFLHSQKKVVCFEPNKCYVRLEEMPYFDENSSQTNGFFHSFKDFMQNVKCSVAEMLSGASSYLHKLFGFSSAEKMGSDYAEKPNIFSDSDGAEKPNIFSDSDDAEEPNIFSDPSFLAETLFLLAVLVAMVVLFKRGIFIFLCKMIRGKNI